MRTTLQTHDGHELEAYVAEPAGPPRGGLVVGHEMYGLNDYIRGVCDGFAADGYLTIAPALYDRAQRGQTFQYTPEDHPRAQAAYNDLDVEASLDDYDAARAAVAAAGKVAVLGFCWGGSLAWLAACRREFDAAIAYYGSWMPDFADEQARCPVITHIGERDNTLPPDRIARFRAAQPDVAIYLYAGALHGFDNPNRTERHDPAAHALARSRTLDFLRRVIG
jgi:carboxymethylenebutenolidase